MASGQTPHLDESAHGSHAVRVLPEGLTVAAEPGASLMEALRRLALPVGYPCGGNGKCGSCRVTLEGDAPPPTEAEQCQLSEAERAQGERLACQVRVDRPLRVLVPRTSRLVDPVILTLGRQRAAALDPPVRRVHLLPDAATVEDPRSDVECVADALAGTLDAIPPPTMTFLNRLPRALRGGADGVTVSLAPDRLLDVEAGDTTARAAGLAIDIGTTTVAVSLHALRTGERLALRARLNPQATLGEDVISRLNHAFGSPTGLRELQGAIVGCINTMAEELCSEAGLDLADVLDVTAAGNAAMNHLLLGVPPESIGLAPYAPVFREAPLVRARDIGLRLHPEARLFVLPNVGGFVGGDTMAGLLAAEFPGVAEAGTPTADETALFIDIGTNCEAVLSHAGRLYAASAPAGPALEGACIAFGMRAEEGAIDDVFPGADGLPTIRTIGGAPARGVCGSGLVHAAATLLAAGAMLPSGLLLDADSVPDPTLRAWMAERLDGTSAGGRRLLLARKADGAARDVWLEQRDLREFQLARAAIVSAWKTLCAEAEIDETEIVRVVIAGAFGSFIRPEAAHATGLIPRTAEGRTEFAGNAALEGARLALLNREQRVLGHGLPRRVRFVELAGREDFDELFALELAVSSR